VGFGVWRDGRGMVVECRRGFDACCWILRAMKIYWVCCGMYDAGKMERKGNGK